ncbi:MAG: hypothetical protein J6M56_00280 [Clostridia bacterium]|nr:hypothetical protein [Clostridia bacterium]
MDEMYKELVARIAALEAKIAALEKKAAQREQNAYFIGEGGATDNLLRKYPLMMDKTRAAEALGVTRATVYAMLSDGRLEQNALGKVITDSVKELLKPGRPIRSERGRKAREALRMGADNP